jgi:hypothetical protein
LGDGLESGVYLRVWFLQPLRRHGPLLPAFHRRVCSTSRISFCVLTLVVMGCILCTPNILGISILQTPPHVILEPSTASAKHFPCVICSRVLAHRTIPKTLHI